MALAKKNNIENYKDTEISTANQGKLIIMLYEGALRFLKIANDNMSHKSYDVVNTNIIKAQDIITELMLSLNMEAGGEIAENLFSLYVYLKKRLIEGNIKKDSAILKEVMGHLEKLKSAWEEASLKTSSSSQTSTTNQQRGVSFSISG
ncbi:MAG: flagellar export chaperone FliS [Candidatus Aminicenantes bacterium]|nr:flagellar export chaperone FliS [Candidatus Aminicenantes bacterium]